MFLDKSIHIHADPARVYAWLAPHRMSRWDPGLVRATTSGGLAPGARIERVAHALGFRFESDAEATAVEPGRVLAWRQITGDYVQHAGAFTLEPEAGGTRLRMRADVELPFVLPRMVTEAEVRAALSRNADAALYNLKDLAEGRAAKPAA